MSADQPANGEGTKIKVGVVGLGYMGQLHFDRLRRIAGVNVPAVASLDEGNARRLAEAGGASFYTSVDDLLEHCEVDALSITLPTALHPEAAAKSIKAGKHTFIEKPLALDGPQAREIVRLSAASGKYVAVGHAVRFWPAYVATVQLVASGALGQPLAARAERLSTGPTWSAWLADPAASGGAVHDFHIHDLDVLNWLFGIPTAVRATGKRGVRGGWDHVATTLQYPPPHHGVHAVAQGSLLFPENYPFTTRLYVICAAGAVELSQRLSGSNVDAGVNGGSSAIVYPRDAEPYELDFDESVDPYQLELEDFVRAIREERSSQDNLLSAELAVRTSLAAFASLETSAPVWLERHPWG